MKRSKYDGELPGSKVCANESTSLLDTECSQSSTIVNDSSLDEIAYIERTTFLADQCNRIDRQLKEIESLYTMVSSLRYELDAAVRKMNKALPAFDAAVGSASNITDGITRAIVKAQNTPIKVALGEDDLKLLASHRQTLIDAETKLIQSAHDAHLNTLRRTLQRDPAIYLSGGLATFITWLFWISLLVTLCLIIIGAIHLFGA
ncbi:MAG: hypothetical protein LUC49_04940 [Prevotella sp.]|nr:hypothetical protein [Prevotella sp.]